MPISLAISRSSAGRPSFCSSRCTHWSTARALRRTLRGNQSRVRSSSIMAPRMRWLAKVEKLAPALASKRCNASSNPTVPAWIKSSRSMPEGSFTCSASACRRTAGRCSSSSASWLIFPCAVYMVFPEPGPDAILRLPLLAVGAIWKRQITAFIGFFSSGIPPSTGARPR